MTGLQFHGFVVRLSGTGNGAEFSFPVAMNGLVYSACGSATVTFTYQEENYREVVKINGPRYLQRISFPEKGKIVFHSECGVSISSENPGSGEKIGALSKAVDKVVGAAHMGKKPTKKN
uniref:Uncharacterized protein n=1 Tax=Candidatus Kentrum sp. LFY TaxID=2126342 RepID=A0A450UD94_9GAMM|nr:MAG: hypothetical protein BECKLFY1418B_GA0070995_100543 [Candidatus Kentron sp. LFY]VFJ90352.1 MAG: hypothetical protein BECKLFY1418A_GA0070994_101127 [Candidatus Kentron sp. LFY]